MAYRTITAQTGPVGTIAISQGLGWVAKTCIVSNLTNQWAYVVGGQTYIPPGVVNMAVPVDSAQAEIVWQAPSGVVQPAPVAAQLTSQWYDIDLGANPGVSVAAPSNPAQFLGQQTFFSALGVNYKVWTIPPGAYGIYIQPTNAIQKQWDVTIADSLALMTWGTQSCTSQGSALLFPLISSPQSTITITAIPHSGSVPDVVCNVYAVMTPFTMPPVGLSVSNGPSNFLVYDGYQANKTREYFAIVANGTPQNLITHNVLVSGGSWRLWRCYLTLDTTIANDILQLQRSTDNDPIWGATTNTLGPHNIDGGGALIGTNANIQAKTVNGGTVNVRGMMVISS